MNKKIRDLLLPIFVIIFIILTTFTSLYASGYKFRFSWPLRFNKILQKTGMLVVETVPKGAAIYLSDKQQKDPSLLPWKKDYISTPAKIKNIMPGEYVLRLELAGYWPLEKKININSGQTTFAEKLNLFRSEQPLFIGEASENNSLKLSHNNKYLYISRDKKIINLKTGQTQAVNLDGDGLWLNDGRLTAGGVTFEPEKNIYHDYTKTIGSGLTNWRYEESTGRFYYQNKDSLNRLESDGKTGSVIESGDYLSYEPRGDYLFTVNSGQEQIVLKDYDLKNRRIVKELKLPNVGRYRFVFDNLKLLDIYDEQNQTLYLVDPNNLNGDYRSIKNISDWSWLNDGQLIYTNGWEIYFFNLQANNTNLITRVSEKITKIIWHKENNYLIFSTVNSLNALDLKTGQITTFLKAEKIADMAMDSKNDTLIFWAKIGQQTGIYKTLLQ